MIFPLSILQDQIEFSDEKKNLLITEVKNMKNNSLNSNYKEKEASWTGDTQGHEFIHKNQKFDEFFLELTHLDLYILNSKSKLEGLYPFFYE